MGARNQSWTEFPEYGHGRCSSVSAQPAIALARLSILGLVLLTACGEQKNSGVDAVPLASIKQQDRQIAEKLESQIAAQDQRSSAETEATNKALLVTSLGDPYARWNSLFQQLAGKKANETSDLVSRMRAAMAELSDVRTSACTEPVKASLLSTMKDVDGAVAEFQTAKDETTISALSKRLGEAAATADVAVASLQKCR